MISKSYKEDIEMIEYCEKNKNDIKCKCIVPDEKLHRFAKSSIIPYYCWYNGCKLESSYLTTEIVEEQKLCKLNLCEISINDIYIKDGYLKIENDCASSINPLYDINKTFVYTNNIDIPNMLKSFFIPVSLLLTILLWDGIEIKFINK